MLAQVPDIFSHPAGDHVAGVAKKDLAAVVFAHFKISVLFLLVFIDRVVRKTESDHFIYFFDCLAKRRSLKSRVYVGLEDFVVVETFVEVVPFDLSSIANVLRGNIDSVF